MTAAVRGNHAELVVDGPACRRALLAHIAGAERRLHLASFVFRPDEAGQEVAAALAVAARTGVEVRVLVDPVSSASGLFAEQGGHGPGRSAMGDVIAGMEAAGVEVRAMRPGGRRPVGLGAPVDHRKLVVADGRRALVPSFGVGATYLYPEGGPEGRVRWHDAATALQGPVVATLETVFVRMWRRYGGTEPIDRLVPDGERGDHAVTVVDVADPTRSNPLRRTYGEALPDRADAHLLVQNAYVSDAVVLDAWTRAARRRPERRITLVRPHPDLSDYVPPRFPRRPSVAPWVLRRHDDRLLAAGVEVREATDAFAHLKLAAVDDRLAVHGSYNLTYRSALLDPELAVLVEGPDHPRQVRDLLAADAARATPSPGAGSAPAVVRWLAGPVQRRLG